MQSLWDVANAQLRQLAVYQPGKPIEETARELGIPPHKIVKLASNENPLGPSPKAVKAMRAAGAPREYLSAAQPLVKLIGELTQRRDCSQVYIQKGSMTLRLERITNRLRRETAP